MLPLPTTSSRASSGRVSLWSFVLIRYVVFSIWKGNQQEIIELNVHLIEYEKFFSGGFLMLELVPFVVC